jgi:putative aldouronate transport system substrate-binding protein
MKTSKNRLLTMTTAIILAVLLVAAPVAGYASQTSGSYGSGEWRTFDPMITATWGFPHDINSDTFTAMANAGEPYDNNRWVQLYRDEVGVNVVYDLVAPNAADYNQNLVLAMSSGDLPDIFYTTDLSLYMQMCEAGVLADMTDIYANEANPTMKNVVEGEGTDYLNSFLYNGRMYCIPGKMPSANYNFLWVRKDWLDKLGLEIPKTMDEVKAVAKAFKEQDPDGNGTDDTLGLVIDKAYLNMSGMGIFWAFGGQPVNDNFWKTFDDGSVGFSLVQPEMKEGLRWLQDMYKEDLLNKDFDTGMVWDSAIQSGFANNTIGMFYGCHWYSIFLNNVKDQMSADYEWIPLMPPTGNGEPVRVYNSVAIAGVYCVNAEYEHPEALVAMFNAYTEKLFGENNDFTNYFASPINGTLWQCGPLHMLDKDVDLTPHRQMKEAYKNGTLDTLGGVGGDYWAYIQSGLKQYDWMFGPVNSCYALVDETYPDIVVWNGYQGVPTPTWTERWSSMQEIILSSYLKIIKGELDVDTGFDSMVAEWNAAGGEQVTKEVNDIVATFGK